MQTGRCGREERGEERGEEREEGMQGRGGDGSSNWICR